MRDEHDAAAFLRVGGRGAPVELGAVGDACGRAGDLGGVVAAQGCLAGRCVLGDEPQRLLRRQRIILSRMGGYVPPTTVPVVNNAPQPSDVKEQSETAAPDDERTEPAPQSGEEAIAPVEPSEPSEPSDPQPLAEP